LPPPLLPFLPVLERVDNATNWIFIATAAGSGKGQRKVDKYGRPLEKESSVNDLKRYYRMESPDADALKNGEEAQEDDQEGSDEVGEEESSEEEEASPAGKSFMDLARGEVLLESSDEEGQAAEEEEDEVAVSEAESDSSSAAGSVSLGPRSRRRRQPSRSPSIDLSETERPLFPDEDDEEEGGEMDSDEEEAGADPTRRVAVVNMDWDNLRASDLYRVLASSLSATATSIQTAVQPKASGSSTKFDKEGNEVGPYKPTAKLSIAPGRLLNLRIYPSTFGRERMEREAIEGPPVEVLRTKGAESDDDEEDGVLRLGNKAKGKAKEKRRRAGEDDGDEDDYTAEDLINDQVEENDEDYDTEALRKYQLERLR
jgi:hypothetical protein